MCGIAGILLASGAPDAKLLRSVQPMTTALRHRGPDGDGFWLDRESGVAFGHRRLAIVDLSETGRQPMKSASGRYVITFNGEIYNFGDLRRDLEAAGHHFRGGSDTEVMLCAIENWGLETALSRFAGMFVFALWDRDSRTLHLARDRLGKKPLYVASTRSALVFASELKSLHAFPDFRPELDLDAAASMLSKGWVPDNKCIWQGAFKLPPGSVLSLTAEDFAKARDVASLSKRIRTWWSLAEVAAKARNDMASGSDEELTTELERLMRLAVRERMIADVPLGAFLSGGVDSSTVVALMQAQSQKPVRTFTIAFGDGGFDESSHAAEVARHLGVDHTELRLTPTDALDVIPELPRIWDEPFADESQIPTLLVSKLARQYVTVALSGDGGDECFAGYSRHFNAERLTRLLRVPLPMRQASAAVLGMIGRATHHDLFGGLPLSSQMRHALRSDRLKRLANLVSAADEEDMYRRLTGDCLASPSLQDGSVSPISDPLSRILFDDTTGYLPGDILVKLDRASMATSLEGRCPILDHRVVEFAWRLPADLKVRNGKGKWILRQLLHRYVPQSMVDRPKQGFDVPVGNWLKGPLRIWASDLLEDARRGADGILDLAAVDAKWRDHLAGRQDHSTELWSVLMFQAWLAESRQPSRPSAARSNEVELAGV